MLGLVDACTWVVFARYPLIVLISDRDIRQEIADGRIVLEPFDESMSQPASVDVRIDRFFRLFDVAARLEGKSSLGRLGLLTHSTAGFIDPGFSGHVTLELSNVATLPIMLWPGSKVGQLCFFRLSSPTEHPYGSGAYGNRYQGQRGPTASRSYLNFHQTMIPTDGSVES